MQNKKPSPGGSDAKPAAEKRATNDVEICTEHTVSFSALSRGHIPRQVKQGTYLNTFP